MYIISIKVSFHYTQTITPTGENPTNVFTPRDLSEFSSKRMLRQYLVLFDVRRRYLIWFPRSTTTMIRLPVSMVYLWHVFYKYILLRVMLSIYIGSIEIPLTINTRVMWRCRQKIIMIDNRFSGHCLMQCIHINNHWLYLLSMYSKFIWILIYITN